MRGNRGTVWPSNQEAHAVALDAAITLATDRVVTPIEETHHVISRRWFAGLGAPARPVQVAQLAVTKLAYGSVRLGGAVVGACLEATSVLDARTEDSIQALVTGLWGDDLDRYEDRLDSAMSVRDRLGASVSVASELSAAFPEATGRIIVLVHGLVETERCWTGPVDGAGLIEALDGNPRLTPVAIRYNSGLRISANGSDLARLLEEVYSRWPVPVQSIALVGHSMGGLVVRSACTAARAAEYRWIDSVGDLVTVGAPHQGAPLEKGVNLAAWGLSKTPFTRPLADFLNRRSVGIKDLRYGAIAESDWKGADPDALWHDTVGDHALAPGVSHHFVAAAVTSDPTHPVGVAVGDLVVPVASGTAKGRLDPTNVVVVGGKRHGDLLGDSVVINQVMDWLTPRAR